METIYDRLKDDIKAKLYKKWLLHPSIHEYYVKELKSTNDYLDITYGAFANLQIIASDIGWDWKDRTHFSDFLKD